MRASWLSAFWRARSRLEKLGIGLLLAVVLLEATGGRPALLTSLLEYALVVAGSILTIRYMRGWLAALMWRLRHRLLITYIFIGVVPVILLLLMAGLAAYIFYGQVATYLVDSQISRIEEELGLAVRGASRDLGRAGGDPAALVRSHLPAHLAELPLEVVLEPKPPAWLKDEFHGLVETEPEPVLRAAVVSGRGVLRASVPVSRQLLERVVERIGTVRLLTRLSHAPPVTSPDRGRALLRLGGETYDLERSYQAGVLRPPEGRFDVAVPGLLTLPVITWESGSSTSSAALTVASRPSIMNEKLFSTLGEFSRLPLTALAGVAFAFLIIEVLSLWIGIRLTRSMTRAVAELYEGTERIHAGNFAGRIPVHSSDQLAALAESFNTMTASLEQLIQEQKEKQRMQSELEIARDVQARLFPKEVPWLRGLELAGLCNPARTVSGDYYDFVAIDDRSVALAIADVAGKGISAALLMASIQSMLHAQFNLTRARAAGDGHAPVRTSVSSLVEPASLVSQLNRQLAENVGGGHFVTFYCAFFDDETGDLSYTNAGHLPPVIIRQGRMIRLEKGGPVLGVFPNAPYDQETVRLERGDVLVAFTDGITEPENSYGEEFGEERLLEILLRSASRSPHEIIGAVMAAVREWTASPEQPDDMTLLVARRR